MFSRIYFEPEVLNYPRAKRVLKKYENISQVEISHYGEVFNLKKQNFRVQKQAPALILAVKTGRKLIETPENFGIGGVNNYYFSHMQNCLYDCRYCFLQGMYNSANYLWFVNYEDFFSELDEIIAKGKINYFFSGYDCDSLVFEGMTGFGLEFLEYFRGKPDSFLEFRTKSVNISVLKSFKPMKNIITAFSFTPSEISKKHEAKTAPIKSRIKAVKELANLGWPVGLRFDPMIYDEGFKEQYEELFEEIFKGLDKDMIHSVSIGPLRFPKKMYEKIFKLYPEERLLTEGLVERNGIVSYRELQEKEMQDFVRGLLIDKIDKQKIFACHNL